jgi:apolipoprotein N-acyltransferase
MEPGSDPAAGAPADARERLPRPRPPALRVVLALAAGASLTASFAPLNFWPLALICPAVLMWLWQDAAAREAAWLGFWFSTATFAAGTYWLYFSIQVGGAPAWLAFALMAGLVAIMGLYQAALGYAVARWLPERGALRTLVALPAAWLLVEWWRGWFLSGFSWLSLGYSQTDTWLGAFAPILGVYGISALLLLGAGALVTLAAGPVRARIVAAILLVAPWALGAALHGRSWTSSAGDPVSVAVVQGAIPQDEKWQEKNRQATLDRYETLTQQALGARLIVWPESAPADVANDIVPYISKVYGEAREHGSALVMGVLRAEGGAAGGDPTRYFNSVLALDENSVTWYDKRHLVPFAEFFPVPRFVRSWMRMMSLPYSDFTRGGPDQRPLVAAPLRLGATVCYEDAYGSAMLRVLPNANALVNVTNDAWFGHSSARHQHFQITRMRALEEGRYLVRAANDGISAVIGPHGEVIKRAPAFTPAVLISAIVPLKGLPPYAHVGNWLIVSLAGAALAYGLWVRNDRGRRRLPADATRSR